MYTVNVTIRESFVSSRATSAKQIARRINFLHKNNVQFQNLAKVLVQQLASTASEKGKITLFINKRRDTALAYVFKRYLRWLAKGMQLTVAKPAVQQPTAAEEQPMVAQPAVEQPKVAKKPRTRKTSNKAAKNSIS